MTRSDIDPLLEKIRSVIEQLSLEERQLLNGLMKIEAEHLHKAQPQLTQELLTEVERYIK